mgnify:CR=1 FL=1|jgi:hypothetical protein
MIAVQASRPSVVQPHSHDYRVRLFADELDALVLSHLATIEAVDILNESRACGFAAGRAGTTEWHGSCQGKAISIAWDWLQLSDGQLRSLALTPPRTNLRVLDKRGYDDVADEEALLWRLVERLQWRAAVGSALCSGFAEVPSIMPPSKSKQ